MKVQRVEQFHIHRDCRIGCSAKVPMFYVTDKRTRLCRKYSAYKVDDKHLCAMHAGELALAHLIKESKK